ncbi:hypothetical protein [Lebetimonas sp. JH292]|uniref:hypothetical protein n=1 Tax=Lebetimonas sp. JH292 TaxID=990068 RepID=UPI001F45C8E1|nr:hypothetical protein [Lebetimonas sp. JH292]
MHHLEPDHSGALFKLMKKDVNFEVAGTGKKISLGNKTIEFLSTPFLHWPDTMSRMKDYLTTRWAIFPMHLNIIICIL